MVNESFELAGINTNLTGDKFTRQGLPVPPISRWRFEATLQACEAAAIVGSAFAGFSVARLSNEPGPSGGDCLEVAVLVTVVVHFVFQAMDLYQFHLISRAVKSLTLSLLGWAVAIGPLLIVMSTSYPHMQYSCNWLVVWSTLGTAAIGLHRVVAAQVATHLLRTGQLGYNVCIVGRSLEARSCALEATRDSNGIALLGYFSTAENDVKVSAAPRFLGSVADLPEFLRCHRVDEVIVTTSLKDKPGLDALIQTLRCLPVRVTLSPEALDMSRSWLVLGRARLGDIPLLAVNNRPLEGWCWVLKDVQDRLLALLLLILFLPLLVIIAIAVRISSRGPVFFRQIREGYNGQDFRILKFRTMRASDCVDTNGLRLTARDDPRIFPLGALLRRTSLDELPQLLNVLRGDMWLIGPRPHSPFATAGEKLYADAVALYRSRYRIKPGITGWAQVNGWRGATDTIEQIEQRVFHDLYYIENWSVGLDFRILMKTGWCGFMHRNAY
jgi:Undecaprenyl-phosphate glucose phosphotransferase